MKPEVQCCSRVQVNPDVRTNVHQTRHLWKLSADHQAMQNLVCIFMSRLEKTHTDKNWSPSQETPDRVFKVGVSWSQAVNLACVIPEFFCPSFYSMTSHIGIHRRVKLHKRGLTISSPQTGLGCTCLALSDISDLILSICIKHALPPVVH